jgi:RNA polymerase sigma-70 factor (ECF subfamily)
MSEPSSEKTTNASSAPVGGAAGETTSLSLLERARGNDGTAWRRVMDLYRPLVLAWCTRQGVRAEDIEDVAQEVFCAAAEALPAFHRDRPGDTFRGWLRGITRNQALMHFRRTQQQVRAEGGSDARLELESVPQSQTDAEDEPSALHQLYRRAVEQVRGDVPERQWQAFWLTAIEDRSPADLTAVLGMTPAAIRQAKSRVLRRLKQELGELLA